MRSILDYLRAQIPNPLVSYEVQQPMEVVDEQVDSPDWLSQLQASQQYAPPTPTPTRHSPIMSMAAPKQAPQTVSDQEQYVPTTGAAMEAESRSSIDKILERMQAAREADKQNDRNAQWMSFFSKLATSKSPTILGGLGESAQSLAETQAKQAANNQLLDRANMENQLKVEEWKREQQRLEAAQAATEKYQEGELELKRAALEQGKYTITPDGLGGFLKINNKTGETESVSSPASGAVAATDDKGQPLTGDDYLKTLDPKIAKTAKMVANGDMPWPGGFALKSPYWQNVIAAAQTYDPTANGNRFMAVKAFNTGKQGDTVRSFDVAISHLDTLDELSTALKNNDTKALNLVKNTWQEQTGSEAPTNFNAAKEIVADELVKAIVGSGSGALGDRESIKKTVQAANSPEQLNGVIKTYKSLMGGQITGLKQQYENSTGRKDFLERISPNSRVEVKRLLSSDGGKSASKTESLPVGIDKITWDHMTPEERKLFE